MTGLLAAPPILFAGGVVGLVGSVLLLRNSEYGGRAGARAVSACWIAAAVLQAFASFGHALRGELPSWAIFSAGNALQLLALSLLWLGTRRMSGRAVPCWIAALPPLIWLAACLVPGFMASQQARLMLFAPLAFGAAFWATFDLLGIYRRHRVRAALDMAVLVGLVMLALLAVVVHAIFAPRVPDDATALFWGGPALLTALFGTTLPFLMLALTREWDALEDGARRVASLQAGRAEVERLLGTLPAVVFLREVAPDGSSRRVYLAGDVRRVTGLAPGEATRRATLGNRSSLLDRHLAAVARNGAGTWDWEMASPDGSRRWMRTHARVLEHRAGGGAEVVGYVLDVTAEREAEARAMAAGRMVSLGEMAAGMAHEIRQPLQAISLAAEIAQVALRRADAGAADERLERIVEHTQRTSELIDRLRRFARGAEEAAPPEAVPLAMAVEGALQLTRATLRDDSIDVEVALGDPAPVVRGQTVLLEQVLSNLLLNARDAIAARPAGGPRRIRIAAEPAADGLVRVTVADTGGGIAPEVMARLFEPFVTTKGPDKGTGLGLSICHGLVKGMGGSIAAENAAEGAVFTIILQSTAADEAQAGQRREVEEIG